MGLSSGNYAGNPNVVLTCYELIMTEASIMQLIVGPVEEGQTIDMADLELSEILERLDMVELTSPLQSLPDRDQQMVEHARRQLQSSKEPYFFQREGSLGGLHGLASAVEWRVREHLKQYIEPDHSRKDRLYILAFQGPWNYIMLGHTTDLLNRVTQHQRAASPHGYVLLNGWASPWLENAQPLEQETLFYAGMLFGGRLGERFFGMPFEMGTKLARLVFEKSSDWRDRPQ